MTRLEFVSSGFEFFFVFEFLINHLGGFNTNQARGYGTRAPVLVPCAQAREI